MHNTSRKAYLKSLTSWTKNKPSRHERTLMEKNCGKKCFLGSKKSFPICYKNTCKISRGGVQAAYIRAREMTRRARTKSIKKHSAPYYYSVAKRAKNILLQKSMSSLRSLK